MSLFSNGQIQLGWMGFIKVLSIILLVVIIIILKIKRNKPFHVFIVRGKMKNSVKTVRVYFKINLFFCVVYPNFISTQKCVSGTRHLFGYGESQRESNLVKVFDNS